MVYVVDAHVCNNSNVDAVSGRNNMQVQRNRLFTSISRSRGWVRVSGVGPDMYRLQEECELLKQNEYNLVFSGNAI